MILSLVRVPVLSVQSTSMAPRFWMASSRRTMTFLRAMKAAPRTRLAETTVGSISGVRPTATDRAKSAASTQSPLVKPLMKKTMGTMQAMKRISSQDTALTPLSKLVRVVVSAIWRAREPNRVALPTASTRARAEPLTTLLPMKARSAQSSGL